MRSTYLLIGILTLIGCTSRHQSTEGQTLLPVTHKEKSKFLIASADKFYSQDDFENAILLFDTLTKQYPDSGVFFYKKAYSESQIEYFKESSRDFLTAANLNYRRAEAYYNAGLNQMLLGDSIPLEQNDSIALQLFKKCLESRPDSKIENSANEFIRVLNKHKSTRS